MVVANGKLAGLVVMLTKNEPADGDGSSAEPKAVLLSSAVHRPSKPKTHSMTDSCLIFKNS